MIKPWIIIFVCALIGVDCTIRAKIRMNETIFINTSFSVSYVLYVLYVSEFNLKSSSLILSRSSPNRHQHVYQHCRGRIQKIQKGVAGILASFIDNIYFTENSLKITENITDKKTKKGKGTAVPSALTLNAHDRYLSIFLLVSEWLNLITNQIFFCGIIVM